MVSVGEVFLSSQSFDSSGATHEPATGLGVSSKRVVVETPNRVEGGSVYLAYDLRDARMRYRRLKDLLSELEIKRLAEKDEVEAVVSHIAEIEEIEVAPYELFVFDEKLASVVVVEADNDKSERIGSDSEILVVRYLTDMLGSRVHKHPDDERSTAVFQAFMEEIEPMAVNMPRGGTLVFCSPPEPGSDYEYEYGFIYILEKSFNQELGVEQLSGSALKVDLEAEEYAKLLNFTRVGGEQAAETTSDSKYADIVRKYLFFPEEELLAKEELVSFLLQSIRGRKDRKILLNGGLINDVGGWLKDEELRYAAIRDRVKRRVEEYIQDLVVDESVRAKEKLTMMQIDSIKRTDPAAWAFALDEMKATGSSLIKRACGVIELSKESSFGFSDPISMTLRGIKTDGSLSSDEEEPYSYEEWEYCVVHNPKEDEKIGKSWCGPCNICEPCDKRLRSMQYQ
jgi:hypothetical protein